MTAPRRLLRFIAALTLAVPAACSHGEPFVTAGFPADTTFAGGLRLTFNPGADTDPVWLPDESGILYSTSLPGREDGDRCLVILPGGGGRVTRQICNNNWAAHDSLNTFEAASLSAGGRVAFVRTSRLITFGPQRYHELAAGSLDSIAMARTLTGLPFTVGTRMYFEVAQIRWLGSDSLTFLGEFSGPVCLNLGAPCTIANVTSGLDVLAQSLAGGPPTAVGGTALASSVALEPGDSSLLYTLLGDYRVYRQIRASGVTSEFYGFAPGTIVRDVQMAGAHLVVVAGGNVVVLDPAFNPSLPPLQRDQGGALMVVDLATGNASVVNTGGLLVRHPALSPSGNRVVVESGGDLWLFDVP